MNTSILITILFPIALAVINGGVLYLTLKVFRVRTISYSKSLLIYIGTTGITLVIFFAFAFFGQIAAGLVVGIISAFLSFCWIIHYNHRIRWLKTIGIYVLAGIITLVISLGLYRAVRDDLMISPFMIMGKSMYPSYYNGQIGLINMFDTNLERGDVVVYKYYSLPNQYFIGRIVGLPGETIEIRPNGYVYADGNRLSEQYLASDEVATHPDMTMSLMSDRYFILGDNRGNSSDSRVNGPIHRENILGVFNPVFDR